MKKIMIFSAAAAMMLASCANEETVEAPKGKAIDFGNVFVNNSTKAADLTSETIGNFAVYGYMANMTGNILDNEEVTKGQSIEGGTSGWSYQNVQYWTPGQNYWFAAIAPYGAASFTAPTGDLPTDAGEGTITYDNTKGNTDLCFAYRTATGLASNNEIQNFTFDHILSRVKFTFTNNLAAAGATIKISNVKIATTNTAGTYKCDTKEWTAAETKNDVAFVNASEEIAQNGNEATEPMYLIPGDATVQYEVSFDVEETLAGISKTYSHTVVIKDLALELGKSYNFTAAINDKNIDPENERQPIEFSAQVSNWVNVTPDPVLPL